MPKKIDEAEVKKECPSCGLGVSLDSRVCEFCGWDFNEEDEWILQIEKLERDLMLEKQKFEPGTVNDKIESTLHAPATDLKGAVKAASKTAPKEAPVEIKPAQQPVTAKRPPTPETRKPPIVQQPVAAKPAPPVVAPPAKPAQVKAPEPQIQETPSGKVRRVRVAKAAAAQEAGDEASTKRRLVRKVKQG